MKRHLAHALRRTARRLIGWSNRLDRPRTLGGDPIFLGTQTIDMLVAKGVPENANFTIAPPGTVANREIIPPWKPVPR